jgi:hypothetical protein
MSISATKKKFPSRRSKKADQKLPPYDSMNESQGNEGEITFIFEREEENQES